MGSDALQLIPVLAGFGIGLLLRARGVVERSSSAALFKIFFYVCMPALIFSSISRTELGSDFLLFPAAAGIAIVLGFALARLVVPRLPLTDTRAPIFFLACMMVNSGFALPFAQALYGDEGVARIAAFDLVNAVLTFSWVHAIAARSNPHRVAGTMSMQIARIAKSPPLIAIVAALLFNLLDFELPNVVLQTTDTLGAPTSFLVTVATGIAFAPTKNLRQPLLVLAMRLATSAVVAVVLILGLNLQGADLGVLLLLCIAPVGFNCVTLASIEKLDVEFATSTLSVSLAISLVLTLAVSMFLA